MKPFYLFGALGCAIVIVFVSASLVREFERESLPVVFDRPGSLNAEDAISPAFVSFGGKDVPVRPGEFRDGAWTLSYKYVHHLIDSAYMGQKGNMVIYGHNTASLFEGLAYVTEGDAIVVQGIAGEKKEYKVADVLVVGSDNVEALAERYPEQLTLYTCTGFLDSKRLVVVAKAD